MALVHWDPTRDLSLLQGDMNRLFERFLGDGSNSSTGRMARWMPAMDIVEQDDHFVLRADLPGLDENDVTIEVVDDLLRISGERRAEFRREGAGFARIERSFGRFERTLTIPDGVDADAIDASFDRGVLEVRVPKPIASAPRQVTIGAKSTREGRGERSLTEHAMAPA